MFEVETHICVSHKTGHFAERLTVLDIHGGDAIMRLYI